MNLLIDRGTYQTCDECHRRDLFLVELGRLDEDGRYSQEAGANLCIRCLRTAVEMIEEWTREPPPVMKVSVIIAALRRFQVLHGDVDLTGIELPPRGSIGLRLHPAPQEEPTT